MHTPIPQDELEFFKMIANPKVVFDVGARADTEYIEIRPEIEFHAFEPNPIFFEQLSQKIGDRPNTYLNNYGLSDEEGAQIYNEARQGFKGGEETSIQEGIMLPLKTLDGYVAEKGITRIDFLKIDTEGYDFKVLMGGLNTIKLCRHIQYEHWNNLYQFHELLANDFYMTYIGNRNIFCTRRP